MNTIYRKIHLKKIVGVLVLSGFLFSSCDLDEKTYNFYNADNYFSSTDRLKLAVNGVYASFSALETYGQNWMVYDTDTDISHVQGEALGHVSRDLGHYNFNSTHLWLQESWIKYYTGIDRSNLIIESYEKVPLKATVADTVRLKNLVAQTRVLRAMCYFDLVRLFGDVPLVTKSVEVGDQYFLAKTDRNVIYDDLIIPEIESAIKDLPWKQVDEQISKGAAMGLLARIYLFRGGYSLHGTGSIGEMKRPANYRDFYLKAQTTLNALIGQQEHGLLNSYEEVFRNMCRTKYDPKENILEIPFFTAAGEKLGSSVQGSYNGPTIGSKSKYGRANSFIKTHAIFSDWYDDVDTIRKRVSVATYKIEDDESYKQIARLQSYLWAPGKWRRDWHTGKVKDNNNTDVNVVLLRYSDVLLMRAEVENELNDGPNAVAIEAINQVYRRALGKPWQAVDASIDFKASDFGNKDGFFDYLFKERARELAFEGHRRLDLVRWNLLDKAIRDVSQAFLDAQASGDMRKYNFRAGEFFRHGVHELYPIPNYDVRESGGLLIQNPGY